AERFIPDPYGEPGARLYRTGDVGRYLADGRVDYLGRADQQIKLRGFRIELGEIEAAFSALDGVREAVVLLREDRPGDPRLVGYFVGEEGITIPSLRQGLARSLPEYMVPALLVRLDELPLTPSGKVDRRALPAVEAVGREPGELAWPRTALEEALVGLWSEVLGVSRLGIHDDFFALGGHSLLATRLISRLRGAFAVELPLRDLFEAPTVAGLARRLEAARRQGLGLETPPLTRVARTGSLPLSFAQQRLWFLQQFEPRSTAYNMPVPLEVRGPLHQDLLDASLTEVLRRHEVLRTTFGMSAEGEPEQRIAAPRPFRFARIDLERLPRAAKGTELRRLMAAEATRPFDLESGPVLRGHVVRLGDEEHALLLTLHHIATDAWSMDVLTREVVEVYRAGLEGRAPSLPALPIQYLDYARWQRGWLSGEVLAREVAHWRQVLAGAPEVTELPLDRPRRQGQDALAGHRAIELTKEETRALRELGRSSSATLFMVVLTGLQALLARYASQSRVSVGVPVAGRNREELEPLIGFFVNTLVLHVDLSGEPTFGTALGRVREAALTAFDHQDLPFEKLVEELQPERNLTHSPLFQVTFALQTRSRAAGEAGGVELPGGLSIAPLREGGVGQAPFDLVVQLGGEAELQGELVYRRSLFDGTTIERFGRHLRRLLIAAADDPQRGLWDLPLFAAAERHQLAGEWNDTRAPYPRRGLYGLFATHAAARPAAPAVVFPAGTLTYGELARRAECLAGELARRGVGVDDRVGICMERSPELFVAILGTLAAGAAYVPLDPGYPAERLAFMVRDSGAAAVLTLGRFRGALPGVSCPVLALDEAAAVPTAAATVPAIPDDVAAEALAFVIYTSGSTGAPKGVGVPQGAVCRLVLNTNLMPFSAAQRMSHVSNISFDAATPEIWGPLLHGGVAVGIPQAIALDPGALADTLVDEEVTMMVLATAVFHQVAREAPSAFRRLQSILVGGEALDPSRARDLLAGDVRPGCLLNGYGPTESTTAALFHPVDAVAAGDWTVPIGRPLTNTSAYVVDPAWGLSPLGAAGELYLGGDGLARGYLGRPDLTAERFVPDPFGAPGARLYRTGDRVRQQSDGRFEFLGRLDGQVKLRSFRIELGEIEAALARQPGVREAVVLLRHDPPGDPRLVGYYVAAEAIP
ncbi:MAG: hypothetical protein QOJ16_4366, partial [Acidobacteriota bacterium]|nr:hypothetical protein [Acidobacteriota bacterium]